MLSHPYLRLDPLPMPSLLIGKLSIKVSIILHQHFISFQDILSRMKTPLGLAKSLSYPNEPQILLQKPSLTVGGGLAPNMKHIMEELQK